MGNKIADLPSYTAVWADANLDNSVTRQLLVPVVLKSGKEPFWLEGLSFRSIAKDKARLLLFFRSKVVISYLTVEDAQETLSEHVLALKEYIQPVKPLGQSYRHVEVITFNGFDVKSVEDPLFRISVSFQRDKANRECLIEAFWRVLGDYMDAFKIPRQRVGKAVSFTQRSYLKVPYKEEGSKWRRVTTLDYVRENAGF